MNTYALTQRRNKDLYSIVRAQFVNAGMSKEVQTTLDNMQGIPLGINKKQRIVAVLTTCSSLAILFGTGILNMMGLL